MCNIKVVALNGSPRAGKDTFVQQCQQIVGESRCFNLSTVDYVKAIAYTNGWDGNKTPATRKWLSDLKDVLSQCPWCDIPLEAIGREIETIHDTTVSLGIPNVVVFVHVREPENIERLVSKYNAYTLKITRPSVAQQEQSNHADADIDNYCYDFEIENFGTIADLHALAEGFLTIIGQV